MKRHLRFALGAAGIAVGCTLAAAAALADEQYTGYGGPAHGSPHPSAPPSHGWNGGEQNFQYNGAPHYQPGGTYPSHQPSYRPSSQGSEHSWQSQHSYPQYRGESTLQGGRESFGDHRYAPGPSTHDYYHFTQHTYPSYHGESSWQDRQRESFAGRGYAPGSWARSFDRTHATSFRGTRFSSFHGRSISVLGDRDREVWRGGEWRHSWHDGRFGWWWFAGGGWYFYDEPIYPYPEYVSTYAYDDYDDYAYAPPDVWYYCAYPQGYYPDVRICMVPWQPVPAE